MDPIRSHVSRARRIFAGVAAVAVVALAACSTDATDPTTPTIDAVLVSAPGGKGGGGGGGKISVTGTTPAELPRGVVRVDLTVSGAGFEPGSDVDFEIDGTLTDGIVTNSVTYVDESTLVANVDVAVDALETLYDVAVRNGPKKKGVGVDLLKVVTEADATPVVEPQVLGSAFSGSQSIFDMSGEWMVGSDEEWLCDFVYNITTDTKECIEIPWADPTDDMAVLLLGVSPSGVVVGQGEDASGEPVPFRIDYANDPTTILRLDRPAGWPSVRVEWDRSINAQGLILGTAHREIPRKGRKQYERIAILWRPDGSIYSMSAPGDWRIKGGLSDVLPDGAVRVGMMPAGIWDGIDGSGPQPLIVQNLAEPTVSVVAPDGTIYGTDRGRVVTWETPSSTPTVMVDLGTDQGLGIFALDEHGNLLGRIDGNEGVFGVCIDLADPVRGVTKLAGWDASRFSNVAMGGRQGRVFGHPSETIAYWDLTSVEGGCSSGVLVHG